MHSHESRKPFDTHATVPESPVQTQQEQNQLLHKPSILDAVRHLLPRLADFIQEHRDLDVAIDLLSEPSHSDQLLIKRLKKRKLQLKDEIARIRNCLALAFELSLTKVDSGQDDHEDGPFP